MSTPTLPEILPIPSQAGDVGDDGPLVTGQAERILPIFKALKPGCWLLNYAPTNSPSVLYDGTFRVESIDGGLRASGDLYQRPVRFRSPQGPRPVLIPVAPPSPANGIPILAIDKYAFFIRATRLLESLSFGNSIEFGLEMWRYSHTARVTNPNVFPAWAETIPCTATMKWIAAPSGFPLASSYLEGTVRDPNGNVLGKMTMGWISTFLRKATVEIDTVAGSEAPTDSGSGHDWSTVGVGMGYELKIIKSDQAVPERTGDSWANSEMHSAMVAHRDANNLNIEWRYHILAVKKIDETPRGIMYDSDATDSNKVPREGVGISTHWMIPEKWGTSSGLRFGLAKAAHFRTAVHELGHALGLNRHNTIDLGFMNTSDAIAKDGNTGSTPFPDNIKWAFADDDLKRLRHRSDMYIRPGGVQFRFISDNPSQSADASSLALDIPELKLIVTPLLTEVPLGAPVRVELKLVNNGKDPILIPARIDLKSDSIRGVVTDPAGTARSFKSLIGCLDESTLVELASDQSITQSVTLLRGGEGALFPLSGVSTITIQLRWALPVVFGEDQASAPDHEVLVSGSTSVFIIGANSESHAKAAHQILNSPDMHFLIAFGGGKKPKCCENALESVLECGVLVPHWEFFVMKERALQGDPDVKEMYLQTGKGLIASHGEKVKLEKLLK